MFFFQKRIFLFGASLLALFLTLSFAHSASGKKKGKLKRTKVRTLPKKEKLKVKAAAHIKKKPKALVVNEDFLWAKLQGVFVKGTETAAQMLLLESKRSFEKASHHERMLWNVTSLARVLKAYQYYLDMVSSDFPKEEKGLAPWVAKLKALGQMRNAISESCEKKKLQKVAFEKATKLFFSLSALKLGEKTGILSKAQHLTFLKLFGGLGTGNELLSYFRLMQVQAILKKSSEKGLRKLSSLLSAMKEQQIVFRALLKKLPEKRKELGLFVYHSALLVRCGGLLQKEYSSKNPAERKAFALRFKVRKKQLLRSLKQTNPSFNDLWRLSKDEK